jgi:hypothetical protein
VPPLCVVLTSRPCIPCIRVMNIWEIIYTMQLRRVAEVQRIKFLRQVPDIIFKYNINDACRWRKTNLVKDICEYQTGPAKGNEKQTRKAKFEK